MATGVNAQRIFTITVTDKTVGALYDNLKKLMDAGLPSTAVLTNCPDSITITITDQESIDRIATALGRLP